MLGAYLKQQYSILQADDRVSAAEIRHIDEAAIQHSGTVLTG